jgi:nitroreductase
MQEYNPKVTPWRIREQDFPRQGTITEKLCFLLRYAILAPSSHNTQPWKFRVAGDEIQIFTDPTRWLKVADPDQRELYISVGCALENLFIAAEHLGYNHRVTYFPQPDQADLAAIAKFTPLVRRSFRGHELFEAIPLRHTNHKTYDDVYRIPVADLAYLQECCVEPGLQLHLTSDAKLREQVQDLVVRGDAIQFADPAFREELGYWIGQGVFGSSWLLSHLEQLAVSYINIGKLTALRDTTMLMSAPVIGLLSSNQNDGETQVKTGQVFERICLAAASRGIWLQPMSQIIELPELKAELANIFLPPGVYPQHTFRLSYAEPEPVHTPRRPLTEVLLSPMEFLI